MEYKSKERKPIEVGHVEDWTGMKESIMHQETNGSMEYRKQKDALYSKDMGRLRGQMLPQSGMKY